MRLFFLLIFTGRLIAQGYICAIGGGSEDYNDWSDAPYSWIVQKADSGKILVLSYSDETEWIPDYFKSLGASEVINYKISSRNTANLQSTYDEIISAKGIFIKGGDQYRYVNYWKGTKTEEAIKYVFNNGGVVAGTSAGEAVLGEIDFSAINGSAYPNDALLNPFNNDIQLEDNFLNLVPGVLFDSHFIERGRFGRLIPMMLNAHYSMNKDIVGIGIDDHTSLCIDKDLTATVMGSGAAAIFYADENTVLANDASGYTIDNLKCDQLTNGWQFDLAAKEIITIPSTAKEFKTLTTFPKTSFGLTGTDNIDSSISAIRKFTTDLNINKALIISHSSYADQVNKLTELLLLNNITTDTLFIDPSNLDNPVDAAKIDSSECIMIAGESLTELSLLADSSSLISNAFINAILKQVPALFIGNAGKLAGEFYIDNTDTDYLASWRGKMKITKGLNLYPDLIFQPMIFADEDFYENRSSAVLYGMMRNRKSLGIYLNGNDAVVFNTETQTISGSGSYPFVIVSSANTTLADSSTYRASGSTGPRQVVAMNNLRYSVSNNSNIKYSLEERIFITTTSVEESYNHLSDFVLLQNYPNPFNAVTNINFKVPESSGLQPVIIKVYDLTGREVTTLLNEDKQPGQYTIRFDASGLSSGVYFYRLTINGKSKARPMVLLK